MKNKKRTSQNGKSFLLFGVLVGFDKDGFVVRINNESRLALVWLFDEFALAVVHGNFIPVPSVGIVRAYFRGV